MKKRRNIGKGWFALFFSFLILLPCASILVQAAQKETIGVKKILGVSPDGGGTSYLNYISPLSGEEFRVSLHRTEDDLVAYCLERTKDSDYDDYNRNYSLGTNYNEDMASLLRNILLCGYPGNTATKLKEMYGYDTNKRNAEQATQMAIWVGIYMKEHSVSVKEAWKAHSPKNKGDYDTVDLSKAILNRALALEGQSLSVESSYVGKEEDNVTYAFTITAKSQYFPVNGALTGLPAGAKITADKTISYDQDGSFVMNQADGTAKIQVTFSRYLSVSSVVMKVEGTIPATSDHDGILFYKNADSRYQSVVVAKDASPVYTEKQADFSYQADKRIQIQIKKEDKSGQTTSGDGILEGAEYTIYDDKGTVKEVLTIGKERKALSGLLPVGVYTVKETKAPVGYLLDEQVYQVDGRNPNPNLEVTIYDVLSQEEVIKGKIKIVKTLENPDSQSEEKIPAEGAVFTYYLNSAPEKKMTITLDENGQGESEWLPYGTYTLEETTAPKGWKKVVPKTVAIEENHKLYTYYMTDAIDSSECKLVKTDKETGKVVRVSGTHFQIREKETGEIVTMYDKEKKKLEEFVTGREGYVILPEKLQAGDYLLYELQAPEGYVREKEPISFTVPENYDDMVEVAMSNTAQRINLVVCKTGEVLVDSLEQGENDGDVWKPVFEEKALKGVVYQLTALEDIKTGDGTVRIKKGTEFEAVTGEDGKALFKDLYPGEYELMEKEAPAGYLVKKEPEKITLTCDNSDALVKEEMVYYKNQMETGTFRLHKQDSENKEPLKGCVIVLKNQEGKVVAKGATDEEGNLEVCNLPIGKYTYREVTSPKGYILNEEEKSFEMNEHGAEITVVMENEKEKEIVTKEDKTEEKQEKKAEKPVKTGDDTPIFFWAVVALLSFTFLITCDIFHKKKK